MTRYDSLRFPELELHDGEKLLTKADFLRGGVGVKFLSPAGTLFLTEMRLVWLPFKTGVLSLALRCQEPLQVSLGAVRRSYQRRSIRWGWMRALVVDFETGDVARFYPLHSTVDVVKWGRAITDLARTHRSLRP